MTVHDKSYFDKSKERYQTPHVFSRYLFLLTSMQGNKRYRTYTDEEIKNQLENKNDGLDKH